MSKRDAAPTLGWVVMSHINKWLAILCLVIIGVLVVTTWALWRDIDTDCSNRPERKFGLGEYQIVVQARMISCQ